MNRTLLSRILMGLLILGLSAPPAGALFGFGKKKDKDKGEKKDDVGPLPGLDAGGVDFSKPPRMAQEAEDIRKQEGLERDEDYYSEHETAVGDHPSPGGEPDAPGSVPAEVVITDRGGSKLKVRKPPLSIEVDAFESIRDTLDPDQNLLLAESPLTVVWRRTHPEFLRNPRVIQPWLTTFSERPGIVFRPLDKLREVLQRRVTRKEAKGYQWTLTLADEEGKVFQHYEGSSHPPEELIWSGQNETGEWMKAGAAYAPVYIFTDPGGTPFTRVGKHLRFKGIVHQERTGLHISLDSSELFGRAKSGERVRKSGMGLLRSAADLIKRRYSGIPIRVEAYSSSKDLADRQAQQVRGFLVRELMLLPQDISTDSLRTPYASQRLEIILLNR